MIAFILAGLVLGGIYAISAASIVVTYVSAGVLNFAFGAIACDHSTSSVVSRAQLTISELFGSKFTVPSGANILKDGGSGKP